MTLRLPRNIAFTILFFTCSILMSVRSRTMPEPSGARLTSGLQTTVADTLTLLRTLPTL